MAASVYMLYTGCMATLSIADFAGVVLTDEQMLAEVQAAIRAVVTGGQSYSIAGSRTVTRVNLGELRALEQMYRQRVYAARGWAGSNRVDLSEGGGVND